VPPGFVCGGVDLGEESAAAIGGPYGMSLKPPVLKQVSGEVESCDDSRKKKRGPEETIVGKKSRPTKSIQNEGGRGKWARQGKIRLAKCGTRGHCRKNANSKKKEKITAYRLGAKPQDVKAGGKGRMVSFVAESEVLTIGKVQRKSGMRGEARTKSLGLEKSEGVHAFRLPCGGTFQPQEANH